MCYIVLSNNSTLQPSAQIVMIIMNNFKPNMFCILANYNRPVAKPLISNYEAASTVVRQHRSTMYIDAAYSYKLSGVVCLSVCLSVGSSVTVVSLQKQLN